MDCWTQEQLDEAERHTQAEVERVKEALGASHVVILAFWAEDEGMHAVDVGKAPISPAQLYGQLFQAYSMSDNNWRPPQRLQ